MKEQEVSWDACDAFGWSTAMEENSRTELLGYLERLRAGENVDPREYLNRYQGGEHNFRLELNLATILMAAAKKRTDQWNRMVASGEVRQRQARVLKKLAKQNSRKASGNRLQ
jgi:hypothetical protein